MPTHTQKKEQVTTQKIVGVSEAEAKEAVLGLAGLAEDSESSNAVKGEAAQLYRELQALPGASARREELMRRAVALAGRA